MSAKEEWNPCIESKVRSKKHKEEQLKVSTMASFSRLLLLHSDSPAVWTDVTHVDGSSIKDVAEKDKTKETFKADERAGKRKIRGERREVRGSESVILKKVEEGRQN